MSSVRSLRSRRGAALATMLMVLVALTILVTAAAARATAERGIGSDEQAQLEAYTHAVSGLQRAGGLLQTISPATLSTIYTFPTMTGFQRGGEANVTATRLRAGSGDSIPALYLLSSTGAAPATGSDIGRLPPARRTVTMMVAQNLATLVSPAGLIALAGIESSNPASSYLGADANSCSGTAINQAAIAVPDPGSTGYEGVDLQSGTTVTGATIAQTRGQIDLLLNTWSDIRVQSLFPWGGATGFRLRGSSGSLFSGYPPVPAGTDVIQRSNTNLTITTTLPANRGILIVPGNLTIDRDLTFDGMILVGGELQVTSGHRVQVNGAVWAGLDAGAPEAEIDGELDVTYDHCLVDRAMLLSGRYGFAMRPGTYFDAAPLP